MLVERSLESGLAVWMGSAILGKRMAHRRGGNMQPEKTGRRVSTGFVQGTGIFKSDGPVEYGRATDGHSLVMPVPIAILADLGAPSRVKRPF
jgi:hypothetical protein